MLCFVGEQVGEDGEGCCVRDAPADPRREKAHRHEEVDVLACRAENRREREHGEPDDHDLLLVELVAENTRCKSEREPEERGSCDPEVDEPLRGVRERLVDVGGDGAHHEVA